MAGEEVDLKKVKRIVRAILLSSKYGCTPKQLLSDYEQNIGSQLPYSQLGFSTLMAFVASMPDVVRVSQNRGSTVLYGVADQSTEQISRMVSRQRPPKRLPISRSEPGWDSPTPSAPKAPVTFSIQLRLLMLAYPSGLEVTKFQEAFVRRFNYHLSLRNWGFQSVDELLRSVPDVVTYSWDSYRRAYMVKQVPKSPRGSDSAGPPPGLRRVQRRDYYNPVIPPLPNSPKPPAKPGESLHALDLSPSKDFISDLKSPPPNHRLVEPRQKRLAVSKQLVTRVQQLLKANPAGIWASRFQLEYKERYDDDLPVSSMGFTSVVSFLSSLAVCELERPSGMGDWLVFAKGQAEHQNPDLRRSMSAEAIITDKLARSIQTVLKAHPSGILLSKFPLAFKDMLKDDLPVEELGFVSVSDLLRQVPRARVAKMAHSCLLTVQLMEEDEGEEEEEEGEGIDEGMKQETKEKPPRPSSYTPQPALRDAKTCGVYVTWVKTPSCMSVQLIGETTTKSLEYLQEDIAQFYSSSAGVRYKIEAPQIGQPCCTIFANDGYWYRAEIVALPAPDIAEVKYVDYGNVGQVPRASLMKPKPHYLALPAQAVDCRLSNLKPAGSSWSTRATQLLFQMTKEKPLVALITSVTNNCMSVCLCDTTTDRDIHINDSLVSQGLALFMPDSQEDREGFDSYQLEGAPVETTGDVLPAIRPPSSAGVVADPCAQPQLTASQLQLQYLQQLLLLQQHNARLMAQPLATPTFPPGAQHNARLMAQPLATPTFPPGAQHNARLMAQPLAMPTFPPGAQHNARLMVQPLAMPTFPPGAQPVAPPRLPSEGLGVGVFGADGQGGQKSMSQRGGTETVLAGIDVLPPLETPVQSQPPPRRIGSGQTAEHMEPTVTAAASKPPAREARLRASSTSSVQSRDVRLRHQTEPRTEDLPFVKRVELNRSHCLHVMRYNGRGYVASCEVSQWFWDSDLLQSMLRQVQTPIWGLLLEQWKTPSLFGAMRRTKVGHLLYKRNEMTVYSLDDLPTIVNIFPCREDLRAAVKREVECWQREGLQYFSLEAEARRARAGKEREMEAMQTTLADLQTRRKGILMAMCQQSEDDGSSCLDKLITVEEALKKAKKRIAELEKELGGALTASRKPGKLQSSQEPEQTVPVSSSRPLQPTKPPDLPWLSVSTSSSSQSSPAPSEDTAPPVSPNAGVEMVPFQSPRVSGPSLSLGRLPVGDVRQSLPSATTNIVSPSPQSNASALGHVDSHPPPSPATDTVPQSPPTSSSYASALGSIDSRPLPPSPSPATITGTVSQHPHTSSSYASILGSIDSHPPPIPADNTATAYQPPSTVSYASALGNVDSHPLPPSPSLTPVRGTISHPPPTSLLSSLTALPPSPCVAGPAGDNPLTPTGPISSWHTNQREGTSRELQRLPDPSTTQGPPPVGHRPTTVDSLTASLAHTSISSPPPSFPDITAALLGLGRGRQPNVSKPPQRIGLGRGRLRRASCEPMLAAVAPVRASFPPLPSKDTFRHPLLSIPIVPGPRKLPVCPPQPGPIAAFPPPSAHQQAHRPQLKAAIGLGRGSERRHSVSLGRGGPAPVGSGPAPVGSGGVGGQFTAWSRRRGGGVGRPDFPPIGSAAGLDII